MTVSIVLACRDNTGSLEDTIKSILTQSYTDFELIIVDDGSKIPVESTLKRVNDPRIKIYRIDGQGLGGALNFGISKSQGKYIVRIDDDDLMAKIRIEKQVDFLDRNEDVVCVGTQLWFKSDNKYRALRKFPLTHEEIVRDLIKLRFSIAHCSVMFRRSSFDQIGGYRVKGGGQDLDLFLQFSKVGKLANLDEFLTYYNLSLGGLSVRAPKNKYRAYLFALESVSLDADFKDKYPNIYQSIRLLKYKVSRKHNYTFFLKRVVLLLQVNFLGKNMI
ncbi:glycosyltransferase family 2 protein [Echinicola jeungdonensis]|uniref:Glycosyltransferase family 2 protein n=1 Tax=Echinicola jeungdonensis TaxID=709343 RepID=A0ABV5J2U6_9BACT|nr:glycosyltransferase family 2 protein [Echinicola jeungdonensis]MDN3668115.1 glycosyltransferase family 2 protein [Echinicola jeungdonensis]